MNPQSGDLHHATASNWRPSAAFEGSPGTTDALPPPVNPLGDDDNDGLNNLIEHVMGENAPFSATLDGLGSMIITWGQRPGGDAGRITLETSENLIDWTTITNYTAKTQDASGSNFTNTILVPTDNRVRKYVRARVATP
jgi:hypothetical protein